MTKKSDKEKRGDSIQREEHDYKYGITVQIPILD